MTRKVTDQIITIGIDIGKNTFHLIGLNEEGNIVLRRQLSRSQIVVRLANLQPCLIGMEACVGAHHLSRQLQALGHDAQLMPAQYVSHISEVRRTTSPTPRQFVKRCSGPECTLCRQSRSSNLTCKPCIGCAHAWSGIEPPSSTRSVPCSWNAALR